MKTTMTPQPKEQSHSPLIPWVPPLMADERGHSITLRDTSGKVVCNGLSPREAGFIQLACNSHARLLAQNEMLRKALADLVALADDVNASDAWKEEMDAARAALEQTEQV